MTVSEAGDSRRRRDRRVVGRFPDPARQPPLRESAIVLASCWGALRMREAADRGAARRVGSAALAVVGAVLLAID